MNKLIPIVFILFIAPFLIINLFLGLTILLLFALLLIIGCIAAITLFFVLPQIFKALKKLSIYYPSIRENLSLNDECVYEKSTLSSVFGEIFDKKVWDTFLANLGIALALYITIIYIVYAIPTTLFDFSNISNINILIWSFPITHSQKIIDTSTIAFRLTFFMIPTFLLSYRLLVNPTRLWYSKKENISETEEAREIQYFKDQILSFYFSFIATTIVIFYLSILYLTSKYDNALDFRLLLPFATTMDELTMVIMFFLEIFAIYIISYMEEKYFEKFKPL